MPIWIVRLPHASGIAHSLCLALVTRSSLCDDTSNYSIDQIHTIYLSITTPIPYASSRGFAIRIEVNSDEERRAAQPTSSHRG